MGRRGEAGMLFLLNDQVMELDLRTCFPPLDVNRFRELSLEAVTGLGAELFAESPLLHRTQAERARRLAILICSKAPEINAALFVAPKRGCKPNQVASRYAQVSLEVMAALQEHQARGALTPVVADREVWRRMAA